MNMNEKKLIKKLKEFDTKEMKELTNFLDKMNIKYTVYLDGIVKGIDIDNTEVGCDLTQADDGLFYVDGITYEDDFV